MRWEDERYVRVYTRDTTDWVALGWEAQSLFVLTMRKVDRAGILDLGKSGVRGLAALVAMPLEVVERALPVLLADGCVVMRGTVLVIPNFIEAQEAKQSDAQRKREQRARDRDLASEGVTNRDHSSRNVTGADGPPPPASESVTPSCAVPSRADPHNSVRERPARVGLGHPAFALVEHWTRVAWPKRSPEPCSPVTTAQAQRLAELAIVPGLVEVKARMDRAVADPFWKDKLDLDAFLQRIDRFASSAGGERAPTASSRRVVGGDFSTPPVFASDKP